jgi:hypothetical protein
VGGAVESVTWAPGSLDALLEGNATTTGGWLLP